MPRARIDLPDGRSFIIEGPTQEAIMEKAELWKQTVLQGPEETGTQATARGFMSHLLDNISGIPDLLFSIGSRTLMNEPLIEGGFLDEPLVRQDYGANPEMIKPPFKLPQIGERPIANALGVPSGEEMVAGIEAASQVPGAMLRGQPASIGGRYRERLKTGAETAQEYPGLTGLGEIGADVITLLTGRSPMIRGKIRGPSAAQVADEIFEGANAARLASKTDIGSRSRMFVRTAAESIARTGIARGTVRAVETGIEGAALAALDEGDPVAMGAIGAGSQAFGSFALTLAKPIYSNKSLLASIGMTAVGLRLLAGVVPGEDNIVESLDQAVFKILPLAALGVLAAGTGFGRRLPDVPGLRSLNKNLPDVAEAMVTTPRAVFLSFMEDISKSPTNQTAAQILESDADLIGEDNAVRLADAMRKGKFGQEVDTLIQESPEFRNALFSFKPPPLQ